MDSSSVIVEKLLNLGWKIDSGTFGVYYLLSPNKKKNEWGCRWIQIRHKGKNINVPEWALAPSKLALD